MKRVAIGLCFAVLLSLWGCVDDRPSIVHSQWVCMNEHGEWSLYFSEQTCQAAMAPTLDGTPESTQIATQYNYIPPKITFGLPDGTQAVGIFYDNYTRLEVVTPNGEYSFMRTQ